MNYILRAALLLCFIASPRSVSAMRTVPGKGKNKLISPEIWSRQRVRRRTGL